MLRLAQHRAFIGLTRSFAVAVQRANDPNYDKIKPIVHSLQHRAFSLTTRALCDADAEDEEERRLTRFDKMKNKLSGTERDRREIVPVEESISYIRSSAFTATYGDKLPWELYRRVHKGIMPKRRTRKNCIKGGFVWTSSPCPICRDKYLVLHHTNLDLLRMFISTHTGQILPTARSGLCQRQHLKLEVFVERAQDLGLLEYEVPFREYNYAEYYDLNKK